MKESAEPKGVYQKLHKIQEKVMGLGKDKQGFGYQYVTGSKVLEHIKPLMNELKLILKQEVLSIENVRQDYNTKNGSKSEILSKVQMRFTWVDCETGERDENLFGANGQNDWDKGVGSALTYAERYFLLKFFHINTDEDDIDNPERKATDPVPPTEKTKSSNGKAKVDKWMSEQEFNQSKGLSGEMLAKVLDKYDNKTPFHKDGKVYGMKKDYRKELESLVKKSA